MLDRRGVTLTELMVAMVIITLGVLGLFGSFRYIGRAIHVAREQTLATNLAQEQIEYLKDKTYYELLVTTAPATYTLTPPTTSFLYDPLNYPPENISVGGINFTRYTLVQMVGVVNDVVSPAAISPDTGMKEITTDIVWADNGVQKVWPLSNLLENPYVNPLDSTLQGVAYDTASPVGDPLPNVRVSVEQFPDYTTTTDANGAYSFRVYHGTYAVDMSAPGYYTWTSGVITTVRGGTTVLNSSMTFIASGTVAGNAWINPNLVISQVVASTITPTLGGGQYDTEYVELYNPTQSQINIATPAGTALINYNFGSGKPGECLNIPLVYVSTYVPAQGYYLIANTSTFVLNGTVYNADAYYKYTSAGFDGGCTDYVGGGWDPGAGMDIIPDSPSGNQHTGMVWITSGTASTIVDAVGWMRTGTSPNHCGTSGCAATCEGNCIPAPLPQGEQLVRISSPNATLDPVSETLYGRAYNAQNNAADFFYPAGATTFGIQFPPLTSATTRQVLTGVPVSTCDISVSDMNSGSTQTYVSYIASGTILLPYAAFSVPGVATGTWTMDIASSPASASSAYYQQVLNIYVPTQGVVTSVPNLLTNPAGNYQLNLTSVTTNGFVKGIVTDANGVPLPGIDVQIAGANKNTGPNGNYFMTVSSGPETIVFNPNNLNPSYISQTYSVTVPQGGLVTQNTQLSEGAVVEGYMTTGTTPVPNFTVNALIGGNIMGSAVSGGSGYFVLRNISTGTYTFQPALDTSETYTPYPAPTLAITSTNTVFVATFTITGDMGIIAGTISNSGSGALITEGALILASTTTLPNASASNPPSIAGSSAPALTPIYSISSKADGTYSISVRAISGATYNLAIWVPSVNGSGTLTELGKNISGIGPISPGATTPLNITVP